MPIRARLFAIADRLQRIQLWLAATALLILMGVTVADVVLRYAFRSPVRGSYDIVESMLLIFVFNGIAAAFFGRRHIVIDLIDALAGKRGTAVLVRVADVLSVVCIGVIMWAMITPMIQAYQYHDIKMELRLPIYTLWVAALVGLTGTLFCAVVTLVARPVKLGTSE